MTVLGIRLEAEQADAAPGANDVREIVERGLRIRCRQVGEKDFSHLVVMLRAGGGATVGRRAQCT